MGAKSAAGAWYGLGALVLALALATPAAGQAVCSAPHSSPVLGYGTTIGTLPPGAAWAQVSGYRQVMSEYFTDDGERRPLLTGDEATIQSVYLTGAVGLMWGVDLWFQVPLHDFSVDGPSGLRERTGLGDIRAAVRVSGDLINRPEIPLAVRAGIKVPGSEFPVDARVIPLTEGQVDMELSVESGTTLGGPALHVVGWVGRRWRGENVQASRKPGDEWFAHAAAGGTFGPAFLEIGLDALYGDEPVVQSLQLESERRRLLQLSPTIGFDLGPGRFDVTAQIPLSGRNLPAAPSVSAGYRFAWGL